MTHDEYLRRNLIHSGAIGVRAGIGAAVDRLSATKRPPKWLLQQLAELRDRAELAPRELAKWRDSAPDAPGRRIIVECTQCGGLGELGARCNECNKP